jgi:hypothetical protein
VACCALLLAVASVAPGVRFRCVIRSILVDRCDV